MSKVNYGPLEHELTGGSFADDERLYERQLEPRDDYDADEEADEWDNFND